MRVHSIAVGIGITISLCVSAQPYPSKPVKMVVPAPAGGTQDIVARIASARISESLGQQLIVENRPGAGTVTGTDAVAKSPADGYTLLLASTTFATMPAMTPNMPYDSLKDFVPVAALGYAPCALVVPAQSQFKSPKDLVAYAKQNPKKLNCGSTGMGDLSHFACEQIARANNIDLVHVPYQGTAPLLQDLIAGRSDLSILAVVSTEQYVKAGKLRALAVSFRTTALSDTPTFAQAGLAGQGVELWYGIVAPKGTPQEVVRKLNGAVASALASPDVARRLEDMSVTPERERGTPEQFQAFITAETNRWQQMARGTGPFQSGGTRTCGRTSCPCTSGCDGLCCYTMYPRP
jgi:tripartite-type tricarboxylate transporter receptor subunit TctC